MKRGTFVGKGVCFDSGGYNLKVGAGSSIDRMKYDMGGSAAVMGTFAALAQSQIPGLHIHACIAACENMISGKVCNITKF